MRSIRIDPVEIDGRTHDTTQRAMERLRRPNYFETERAAVIPSEDVLERIRGFIRRVRDRLRDLTAIPVTLRLMIREIARSAGAGLRALGSDISRSPRPLRIGVDIRPFYEPLTGVGWYLYEILRELARREDLEIIAFGDARVTDEGPFLHVDLPERIVYRTVDLRGREIGRYTHALTALAHPLMMRLERIDLFFGGNYFLPRVMNAVATTRVVTVHDLTYRKKPELLQTETLESLESHMQRELARADAIICVSHATRRDLVEEYEIDESRVIAVQNGMTVVTPGREPASQLDLPSRYILFVSTIEPRKNLDILLDAFEMLRDTGTYPGDLVVAGRVGWKAARTVERLATSRWASVIHHLDYVPRERLDEIYRHAEMFVLPSHYEGFGFPILEAMAHRVPVVTTNVSSLPEVGGDAALYFDPGNAESLADAIERLASDESLCAQMIERGTRRVEMFDWKRAASETMDVFVRVTER